eukprot:TRINITY_DN4634_c0_g1_i1.p1 TRINITY_DN4634_c0_g1~~TRINITY_DN4634_c0_g1_i1.p1  ORF type:complete len:580 (-),score=187.01 TRINITY_DN4634_c0_g1_i1:127-1866(-)
MGLFHGDRNILYPVLHFMLSKLPELKTRAYLARFLVNVEVPEELFADEGVVELYQQYKDTQDEFKEVHKNVEKLRKVSNDPVSMKKENTRLAEEKEQLNSKIEALKNRLKDTPNYESLLTAVSDLRREKDEEVKLAASAQDQRAQLAKAEEQYVAKVTYYRDLKSATLSGGPEALVKKLGEEKDENYRLVTEKLPKEIEARSETLRSMQAQMATHSTDEDVQTLQGDINELRRDVEQLKQKQREHESKPVDERLNLFRQQAVLVAKRKQEIASRASQMRKEKVATEEELASKQKQFDQFRGTKILKGDAFKKYAASLRDKNNQYKQLKGSLNEMRAEWGILQRTKEILSQRSEDLGEFLKNLEKARGVEGYTETQAKIQQVSALKANFDKDKGQTLEEISRVVQEINQQIKERKSQLAPQVKELRAIRNQYQELEGEYREKKLMYDNTKAGLDSNMVQLQQEVSEIAAELHTEESRYHYLNANDKINSVLVKRAKDDAHANLVRQAYTKRIQQQEEKTKEMRGKQKQIKDSHAPNMEQLEYFRNLKQLLRCKQSTLQKEIDNPPMYGQQQGGYADPMIM